LGLLKPSSDFWLARGFAACCLLGCDRDSSFPISWLKKSYNFKDEWLISQSFFFFLKTQVLYVWLPWKVSYNLWGEFLAIPILSHLVTLHISLMQFVASLYYILTSSNTFAFWAIMPTLTSRKLIDFAFFSVLTIIKLRILAHLRETPKLYFM
jgi:hypothetical protein